MAIQIQLRRGTSVQWAAANTILALAELAIEIDTSLFKVGDGVRQWSDLPYGGIRGYTGSQSTVIGYTGSRAYTGSQGYTGSYGPIAGSDSQVVFNNNGIANGSPGFTFNLSSNTLTVSNTVSSTSYILSANLTNNNSQITGPTIGLGYGVNTMQNGPGGYPWFFPQGSPYATLQTFFFANSSQIQLGNNSSYFNLTSSKLEFLDINGNPAGTLKVNEIYANNQLGTSAQILTSNSTGGIYWNSSFAGTANNTLYVGSVSAVNVVSNSQLSGNLSYYTNTTLLTANLNTTYANSVLYTDTKIGLVNTYISTSVGTSYLNSVNHTDTVIGYVNTAITANASAAYSNSVYHTDTVIGLVNTAITANASAAYSNSVYHTDTVIGYVNTAITANASSAYSNSVYHTDTVIGYVNTAITSNSVTAYSNAVYHTDTVIGLVNTAITANASSAYSNSVYHTDTVIGLVNTAITANASAAYSNAVYHTDTVIDYVNTAITANASAAYSNSVYHTDTVIGLVNTAITANASAAYSNSVYHTDTVIGLVNTAITSNSTTAYSNAVYHTDTVIGLVNTAITANASSAYSNSVYHTDTVIGLVNTAITANASAAYSNAVLYVSNQFYVNTSQLSSNLSNYQTTAGLSGNVALLSANNASYLGGVAAASYINTSGSYTITGVHTHNANLIINGVLTVNNEVVSGNGFYSNSTFAGSPVYGDGIVMDYITGNGRISVGSSDGLTLYTGGVANIVMAISNTTGLYVNGIVNATSFTGTANNTLFVGAVSAANVVSNAQLIANLANYQTITSLSSSVSNLTSNNTAYVGAVSAANVVSNSQLQANLANYATLSGATYSGAVVINNNLTVSGNVSIGGNLTFSGNTFIIGANNLIVQDAVISLHTAANLVPLTGNDGRLIGTAFHYFDTQDRQALLAITPENAVLNYYSNSTDAAFGDPVGLTLGVIQANSFIAGNSTVFTTTTSTNYSGTANNTTYAFGKTESNLNVNNSTYAFGKTESNLNVNNAATANNSSYLNNKSEANLNVNNAVTANNSSYLGGVAASNYINTSGSYTITGIHTHNANLVINSEIIAGSTSGSVGQVLTSNGSSSKVYWSTLPSVTVRSTNGNGGAVNTSVSGITGINFDESTGLHVTDQGSGNVFVSLGSGYKYINVAGQSTITAFGEDTLTVANGYAVILTTNSISKTLTIGTDLSSYQTISGLAGNVALLSANNASYLGGVAAASYVNTSGTYTLTGTYTFNTVLNTSNGILSSNSINVGTLGDSANLVTISPYYNVPGQLTSAFIALGDPGWNGPGGRSIYAPQGSIFATQTDLFFANASLLQMGNNTVYTNLTPGGLALTGDTSSINLGSNFAVNNSTITFTNYKISANGSYGTDTQVLKANSTGGVFWGTGISGFTGSQGNLGYSGSLGNLGYAGSQGTTGFVGSQGNLGYAGSQGNLGYAGSQGNLGYAGSTGFDGSQGTQGTTGFVGSQGNLGYVGSQGTTGFVGSQGNLGYAGSTGFVGSQGTQGYWGSTGFVGSQGNLGYAGSTGFVGSQGNLGYAGSTGFVGSQGTGYAGSSGYTGSIGTGYAGSLGYSGSIGNIGYTGSAGSASGGSFSNGQSISVANLVITGSLTANSSTGTAGQVLTSNGTAIYWANSVARVSSTNAISQTFTGDGTTAVFTLSKSVANQTNIIVSMNGLLQIPTTHYTISSTSLTFTTAPYSGTVIEARNMEGVVVSSGGGSGGGTNIPRVYSTTTDTAVTPNTTTYDMYVYTALAATLTINASTNSPTNGTKLMFRFKDNGTAQTLTWTTTGSGSFRIIGTTLPTATTVSKVTYVGCVYNSDESYWDVIAVGTQA